MRYLVWMLCCLPLLCPAQHTRPLDAFSALSVTGNIELRLIPGESPELTILSEEVAPDDIRVKLNREKLQIRVRDALLLPEGDPIRIAVTYLQLRAVTAHLGAVLYSEAPLYSEDLRVRATSGSDVELEVYTNALDAGAFEGSRLHLRGEAFSQKAAATTGGNYLGEDLNCRRTKVKTHTGGKAWVVATEELEASANTGGQVHYFGEPELRSLREGLSGEVDRAGDADPFPTAQ